MTIIHGQIESLKKIKETLHLNNIHRFQSVGEITQFKRTYQDEKREVSHRIKKELDEQIKALKEEQAKLQSESNQLEQEIAEEFANDTAKLNTKLERLNSKNARNILSKAIVYLQKSYTKTQLKKCEKRFSQIRNRVFKHQEQKVFAVNRQLSKYIENRESIILKRSDQECIELDHAKSIIDQLDPLIAGAIGENLVEK